MNNQDSWIFVSIFPNLLETYSFKTSYAVIVPCSDSRVKLLRRKYKPIDELLNSFIDTRLKIIRPNVFLLHKKAYSNQHYRHAAIVAFRNIVALNVILEGWIPLVHATHNNVFTTLYSDYYDFFPLNGYGDKLYFVKTPALSNIVSQTKVKYQSNYSLPEANHFTLFVNQKLFDVLIYIWEDYFVRKKRLDCYSSLFRSLQLAFSACKMPTDNFSTIYDYGTKIGLWISAFEILFHPGKNGSIHCNDIIAELNKYEFSNPKIKKKSYLINKVQTNIVGLIYKEIYDVRNDFFHGNNIDTNRLYVFKQKKFPIITHIAPVLFLMALHVFLQSKKLLLDVKPKNLNERIVQHIMHDRIEEVFTKIIRKKIVTKYVA